ncbi:BMP family ABC transporter substrate-binding protein [candidate division KSB3 bacterium]|uniref:BMP family ABC transporter substrate-binding protein n=1 Tax=candidate division KSB3 bacterium TaxID=2044937 RepID=A0A2G6E624_9BACT|nr:MAG: BMP family ABC transporter substrate-binding protein [candidate division KSB3 bacterium]PIE30054.1 MAG: BMP family ABC transporter substrate-binding protein [candidate division KSB3 bacterium]
MHKKIVSIVCIAVFAVGLLGGAAQAKLRVGMVFDVGGKGDQSFNDSAFRGLQWAAKDLGINHVEIEPGADADRETGLRMIASQGFDYVIGVGFLFEDAIRAVADEFPDIKFGIVDGFVPDKPNVASLRFREQDGSFLVGIIAAMKAQADGKDTVGFVGGMDIPLIHKFEAGYKAGVEYACADCKILSDYAGSAPSAFADPVKGKELALAQIDKGAYVIYHASGLTGAGVYEAGKEREVFVIGVDSNQNHLGYVEETADSFGLTSMLKQVDVAVYLSCKDVMDGSFEAGVREFGLKDSVKIGSDTYRGVYFAIDEYNEDLLTQDILDKVAEAEAKIISGEITVPSE